MLTDKSLIFTSSGTTPLRETREELGRISWTVLHSFAAGFPDTPSSEDIQAFQNLINSFSQIYPCGDCRNSFKTLINKHPPNNITSRKDAVLYVCKIHNFVNERLGKPQFDCQKAFEFWGGDCGCDGS